jgi:hypothetical protein
MDAMQTALVGIDSLIHATGHPHPAAPAMSSTDVQALRDDVREAIVAIYCDHDEQAARRVGHARWLLREGAGAGTVSSVHIEEAAFHLRQHHPWEALSALRLAGDALLAVQPLSGERS